MLRITIKVREFKKLKKRLKFLVKQDIMSLSLRKERIDEL